MPKELAALSNSAARSPAAQLYPAITGRGRALIAWLLPCHGNKLCFWHMHVVLLRVLPGVMSQCWAGAKWALGR